MATIKAADNAARLYLNLLKRNLTRTAFGDRYRLLDAAEVADRCPPNTGEWLAQTGMHIVEERPFNVEARVSGSDWPAEAETMVGMHRLNNIEACVRDVLANGVPGDLVETGVWRGGCCILMRGILAAYGDTQRTVWVADSFQGLPRPDPQTFPLDGADTPWGQLWMAKQLAIPLETVKENFARYELLDHQVRFVQGWFRDTLPSAPIERIAVLRLDGDLYESTVVALQSLYAKVSRGGFVLVDDYGAISACKQAVDDFRAQHSIEEPIHPIDWTGVFWKVERSIPSAGL